MKTFKFSLVLRTRENTDVFITLDDNNYGIHSKRENILYVRRPLGAIKSAKMQFLAGIPFAHQTLLSFSSCSQQKNPYASFLTLVMLNKFSCHSHF